MTSELSIHENLEGGNSGIHTIFPEKSVTKAVLFLFSRDHFLSMKQSFTFLLPFIPIG